MENSFAASSKLSSPRASLSLSSAAPAAAPSPYFPKPKRMCDALAVRWSKIPATAVERNFLL